MIIAWKQRMHVNVCTIICIKQSGINDGLYMWMSNQRDKHRYLSIDLIGLLSSTAEQVPSFVLNVTNMDVVSIVFTKWNPSATKHKQVVAVQNS